MDCELCTSRFVRKESYRNHVLTHHQELNKTDLEALLKKIRKMKPEKECELNDEIN